MRNSKWWAMTAITVVAAVACSSTPATPPPATAPAATPVAPASQAAASQAAASAPAASHAPAVPKTPTGYAELDQALTPNADGTMPMAGKTVDIQVQWTGTELANFQASVADFAAATGITVQIDSVPSSHETVLKSRIEGGSPPDIAQLAQPTPVLAYAAEGKVINVAPFMDNTKQLSSTHQSTIGLLTQGSSIWGIPYKADVKSLIWYPIKSFAAAGYTVPKTFDDLIALSNKIVADGHGNPWCVSAGGPGDATGWQLTDWVEEAVLKTQGLDYYNNWINHTVTFEDPGIVAAMGDVAKILFAPNFVYGGNAGIVNTDQKTTMDPMFPTDGTDNWTASTPKCWMQKIPTWYGPGFFPDQRVSGQLSMFGVGTDVGIFPFPTINPADNYIEGSADTMMMLADRPEVRAVAEFLATPEGLENWITSAEGAISPNSATPASWYANNYTLSVASGVVSSAAGIGFDASDLMPGAVGTGTFWTEMVDWANSGGTNTSDVLKAIDDSWPASQ